MTHKTFSALAIDDDELTLEFYRDYFSMNHVDLVTVKSAEDGLMLLSERDFDVLILDLCLEGGDLMEGRRVLQKVAREYPRLEVVLVTAHCEDPEEAAFLELGAHTVLRKPCTMRAVFETAEKAAASSKKRFTQR